MIKKLFASFLCVALVFSFVGCALKKSDNISVDDSDSYKKITSSEPEKTTVLNPLTGLEDLDEDAVGKRPVAIMINNVTMAWSVQKGLTEADIVYETYAEGGVTRLMAVFSDITKAKTLGTCRSARYTYVDLASGHDAIYVHCGLDPNYCKKRIAEIKMDDFDINTGKTSAYGFRVKNGKALEHTMYTSGEKITEGIQKLGYRTDCKVSKWASFNKENSPVTPAGGECTKLTVPMNGKTYCSTFTFDSATGRYTKTQGSGAHIDYNTNQALSVKNILVLFTSVGTYPDGKHMDIGLSGGSGYYISNGGYQKITWSKGTTASNQLKFADESGNELVLNAGNSWIFLADKNIESNVTFGESATPAVQSAN